MCAVKGCRGAQLIGGAPTLFIVAAALTLIRLPFLLHYQGIYWPDEIFQSLEPAHALAFGYGLLPWEFQMGARTWILPGFLSSLMRLPQAFGFSEPETYILLIRLFFVALSVSTALAIYRFCERRSAKMSRLVLSHGASAISIERQSGFATFF